MTSPWTGHEPLELEHIEGRLVDITVAGKSVSEWLQDGLWEQAEEHCKQWEPELHPSIQRKIERMDKRDEMEDRMR